MSLLKLLEINAFLEAFHVPSFSGPEVFSGIFCRNVKVPERARTPLIIYCETLQFAMIYLQTRKNNLKVHKMTENKKRH